MNVKSMLEEGYVVVCDTNVFLDVYRCSPQFSDFSLNCLSAIKEFIVVPATVKLEYEKHCRHSFKSMERNIISRYGSLDKQITGAKEEILKTCYELESFQISDIIDLKEKIEKKFQEIEKLTKEFFEERSVLSLISNYWGKEDLLQKFFDSLVDNQQVMESPTQVELYRYCEEGEQRYKDKIPPGFKDAKNKKDGLKRYSDLVIWKEVIKYAKKQRKNIIFVTNDLKNDWWQDNNGKKEFHSSLLDEFHKKGKMEIVPFTSVQFYEEISNDYGIEVPDTIEIALKITDNDYFSRINDEVFESIIPDLIYSSKGYSDLGDFDNIDELEITHYEFVSASQSDRDNDTITYVFIYRVEAEGEAREWLGRDAITQKPIIGEAGTFKVSGEIKVEVIRSTDIYLDFEGDSGFEEANIIGGTMKATEFIPLEKVDDIDYEECLPGAYMTCSICGGQINEDNDGRNGYCINCSQIMD